MTKYKTQRPKAKRAPRPIDADFCELISLATGGEIEAQAQRVGAASQHLLDKFLETGDPDDYKKFLDALDVAVAVEVVEMRGRITGKPVLARPRPRCSRRRSHRRQSRGSSDDESDGGDPPDPPTTAVAGPSSQRQLYDQLRTIYQSGRFPYFATLRVPQKGKPSKGFPSFNPEALIALSEEIALSLAAQEGIAAAITISFQSVNTQKQVVPHLHLAMSGVPSEAWVEEKQERFGPTCFQCA